MTNQSSSKENAYYNELDNIVKEILFKCFNQIYKKVNDHYLIMKKNFQKSISLMTDEGNEDIIL